MCGLTGGWTLRHFDDLRDALPRMTQALVHRGPDDSGVWSDPDAGIALGHRRLSIVDLSPAGHQPMLSASGRWVIVLNGEIYNHLDLRKTLESTGAAPNWRGHSDTETLLAAFEAWGFAETLRRSVGMFAIALWDRRDRMLWLARDRLGEKPIYYGWNNHQFLFGSELKAIRQAPGFDAEVDREALTLFMRHGAVPSPFSIYREIAKLPPGTYLGVTHRHISEEQAPQPEAYWSAVARAEHGRTNRFVGTDDQAVLALETLLGDAIGGQMLADVPLGAFLSGGVDSSTIVALMQARSGKPVRTFTIGFDEAEYNEAEHAKAVAKHLGTDHTELYVQAAQALDIIPTLPHFFDEPFADSSQIPTMLVSAMARRHVTVCLSGDAGDELFLGYPRYEAAAQMRRMLTAIPRFARLAGAATLRRMPLRGVNAAGKIAQWMHMSPSSMSFNRERAIRIANLLESPAHHGYYPQLMTCWSDDVVVNDRTLPGAYDRVHWPKDTQSFLELLGLLDLIDYLPNDILTKVDRAAMSVSIETRVPLLDHRVVEFALSLPLAMKRRNGQSKWLLRQVLYRHVPRSLIERPKMGFGVPIAEWLRGPLKEWAGCLLDPARLKSDGFFNPGLVAAKWQQHLSGERNWQAHLWSVLMFQAWLDETRTVARTQDGTEALRCAS